MINKKKIIIIISTLAVVILAVVTIVLSGSQKDSETVEPEPAKVIIDNQAQYNQISDEVYTEIKDTLYGLVVPEDSSSNIIGKIRNDSMSRENTDSSVIYSFVVDFASEEKSWKVNYSIAIGDIKDPNPVWVECLEEDLVIYNNFECVDLNDQ